MDEIIRAISKDGFAKISVISGSTLVERARRIHDLSPVATAALGRTLLAASILGDLLKENNATVTLRINGGGPIGSIIAVADSVGNVRGYVGEPSVDIPLKSNGKLDVGSAVGKKGLLTVSRDLGLKEPYIGSVELESGEIAEDLTKFFVESEQVGAACGLGVLVRIDRSVACAGGFLVQLLPDAPESVIDTIEDNIASMGSVTDILSKGGAEDLMMGVFRRLEPSILVRTPVEYRCYCSRERVRHTLESLGRDELESIIKSAKDTEVVCHFCNEKYTFSTDEIKAILNAR